MNPLRRFLSDEGHRPASAWSPVWTIMFIAAILVVVATVTGCVWGAQWR